MTPDVLRNFTAIRGRSQHSPIAHDVYLEVKKKNPNAAKYMGSFSTKSDHTCHPLQAADSAILRGASFFAYVAW
jgi:hypothetical protein